MSDNPASAPDHLPPYAAVREQVRETGPAPGSSNRVTSARPTATGMPPTIRTPSSASVLPGRCLRSGVFTS